MIYPLSFTPGVAIGINIEFLFSLKNFDYFFPILSGPTATKG